MQASSMTALAMSIADGQTADESNTNTCRYPLTEVSTGHVRRVQVDGYALRTARGAPHHLFEVLEALNSLVDEVCESRKGLSASA